MSGKRVFIVDDSPVVRRGLSDLIGDHSGLEVCGEASGVAEALSDIEETRPDLVLLDCKLEDSSGLDLLAQMKGRFEGIKVLVCSVYEEATFAERVIRAGASGFVSKNATIDEIIEAVRSVLAGRIHVSEEFADQLLHRLMKKPAEEVGEPRHASFFDLLLSEAGAVHIAVPPLRTRQCDVPLLSLYFAALANIELDLHIRSVSWEAQRMLQAYSWPGNVRELMNAVTRAALTCGEGDIEPGHLPKRLRTKDGRTEHAPSSGCSVLPEVGKAAVGMTAGGAPPERVPSCGACRMAQRP